MRTVDSNMKKIIWTREIVSLMPILLLLIPILSGIAGVYAESWFVFGALMIAGFIIYPHYHIKKIVTNANKTYQENWSAVADSLDSPNYIHTDLYGAVGVDVANRKISLFDNTLGSKKTSPIIFDADKVEEYGVTGEGYSQWESLGNDTLLNESKMMQANVANETMAAQKTGLYFLLDDLHQPKLLSSMTTQNAEEWMRLLSKFAEETLEMPSTSPAHFPAL